MQYPLNILLSRLELNSTKDVCIINNIMIRLHNGNKEVISANPNIVEFFDEEFRRDLENNWK